MLPQHGATSIVHMSFIILERGKERSEKRERREKRRGKSGEEKKEAGKKKKKKIWEKKGWLNTYHPKMLWGPEL